MDSNPSSGGEKPATMARGAAEGALAGVALYWIPLGAGGAGFVRLNGRIYEAITARREHRRSLVLYHAALEVHIPEGGYVIEMTPIPGRHPDSRGVVVEGPVGARWLSGLRVFRYEVRRWRSGVIPDVDEAVASPQWLSDDPARARRLLELVAMVPALVWGRDQVGVGDMWNSNSLISWLLARTGLPAERVRPPTGGRAPGWRAGIIMAHRHRLAEERPSEIFGLPGPVRCSTASNHAGSRTNPSVAGRLG